MRMRLDCRLIGGFRILRFRPQRENEKTEVFNTEKKSEKTQRTQRYENNNRFFKDLCGIWRGKVWMADIFFDPLDELKEYME